MKQWRVCSLAAVLLVCGLAMPAAAQGPSVTSATLTDSFLTVVGERLGGASVVTVGGLAVGGVTVNPAGTLLMGTVLGALADGSHLLVITAAAACPGPAPGADWVCTLEGGWVPPSHPLASTGSMSTVFVVTAGSTGGTVVPGPAGPVGPTGPVGPAGPAGATGPTGAAGPAGVTGATGPAGPAGATGAAGATGSAGPAGIAGSAGATGATGAVGPAGPAGIDGLIGAAGPAGVAGAAGSPGAAGLPGAAGPSGATGAPGPAGPAGVSDFADFFALMPPDNAATVAPGTDVSFPQDGPSSGTGLIARLGPGSFNLAEIGFYSVTFQVGVTETGQFILTLNGADLAYTVAGRSTGASQIAGTAIVQTTSVNSILTVQNPAGNTPAMTITPLAGGARPVSAHLVVVRLR